MHNFIKTRDLAHYKPNHPNYEKGLTGTEAREFYQKCVTWEVLKRAGVPAFFMEPLGGNLLP